MSKYLRFSRVVIFVGNAETFSAAVTVEAVAVVVVAVVVDVVVVFVVVTDLLSEFSALVKRYFTLNLNYFSQPASNNPANFNFIYCNKIVSSKSSSSNRNMTCTCCLDIGQTI